MSESGHQTETIGRLPHLLTHVATQLPGLLAGADTFEDIPQRYGQAMNDLAARGQGRVTAPCAGVGSAYRYWSSTRDLVKELQQLGWVQSSIPAPSTKEAVDAHRSRHPLLGLDPVQPDVLSGDGHWTHLRVDRSRNGRPR